MTDKQQQNDAPSHEQGQENSHLNLDGKDQKSLANKLSQASKQEKREEQKEADAAANKAPPTQAARDHGNKPSRGARIDEQIENEEREELRKKGVDVDAA